ncbi:hypothetical protein [Curtobacterium flaccumfaciens]|uniref:hypothetical protein n=1 Tax=Curtobacterium flaccumfaciens TaxID=2035 RepID=UPI0038795560
MPGSGSESFDKLRSHLIANATVRREIETAYAFLLARANPSDRAARFVFGGASEWIVAASAWSAGVLTTPQGHNANGYDLAELLTQSRGLWSVKTASARKPGEWRITNGLGDAGKGFEEPTLFVHKDLGGFLYIDPAAEPEVKQQQIKKRDAYTLPFKVTKAFADSHPENLARLDLPVNEGQAVVEAYTFERELLAPNAFPNLSRIFVETTPLPITLTDEIRRLNDMAQDGSISQQERDDAIARLLRDH